MLAILAANSRWLYRLMEDYVKEQNGVTELTGQKLEYPRQQLRISLKEGIEEHERDIIANSI